MSKSIDGVLDNEIKCDVFANKDEALEANLNGPAKTEEPIDLTHDDTDDEFEGPYTSKLRPNKRLRLRKLRHKIMRRSSQASNQINRTITESASDDSSVMSRFSVNESDQEKESSAKPPAKKRAKKIPAKKSNTGKKPRGKNLPTRAKKSATSKKASTGAPVVKGKRLVSACSDDMDVIPIATSYNLPLVTKVLKDVYFLLKIFDHTYVHEESYSKDQMKSPVELVKDVHGRTYELLYSKFVSRKQNKPHKYLDGLGPKYYKSYYIGVSGFGGDGKLNIAEQLSRVGDFPSVAYEEGPEKLIARLSLLVSPACKSPDSRKVPLVHDLHKNLFQVIEDNGHEGCGFVPRNLIVPLLGKCKRSKQTIAIQVRFFSPTGFGVGKGLLMVKENIDKIEIPTSMIKVKKSAAKDPLFDSVVLVISGIFPTAKSIVFARILDPNDNPTDNQVRKMKPPKVSFQNVMLARGVLKETLYGYISKFKKVHDKEREQERLNTLRIPNEVKHASLVGVADPTDSIPPGFVFLTGLNGLERPKKVFLTRSPCTEASDGMVVKVCGEEDVNSFSDAYEFLSGLPFGVVVFPLGEQSLPPTINSGDLDGDFYFAIWDETISNQATNNDGGCVDAQFNICDDDLLGQAIRYGGKRGVILGKSEDGTGYIVKVQCREIVLSKEEIMNGRSYITSVIGHSGKKKTIFEVEWENGSKEKVASSTMKKNDAAPAPAVLAYVKAKGLAKTMEDCKWFNEHFEEEVLVKIAAHRCLGNSIKVLSQYSDGSQDWEPLSELLVDSKLIVGKYAKEQGLAGKTGWESASTLWLRDIQETLEMQREHEVNLLVTRTCSLWKKVCKNTGPNCAEALIWGRAYKSANELLKHGGRVKLPLTMYHQIIGKTPKKCKYLQLLEPINGYVETACFHQDGSDGWGRASSPAVASGRQVCTKESTYGDSGCGRQYRDKSVRYNVDNVSTNDSSSGSRGGSSIVASQVNNGEHSSVAVSTDGWNRPASTKANPVTPTNASNSGWGRAAIGGDMNKEPKNDSGWGRSPGHTSAGTGASSSQGWNNNGMDKESVLGWGRPVAAGNTNQDSNNDSGWGRSPANLSAGVGATGSQGWNNNCVNENEKAGDSGWDRSTATGNTNQDSNNDSGWGRSPANLSAGVGATGSQGWDSNGKNDEAGDSGWGRSSAVGRRIKTVASSNDSGWGRS